MLASRDRGRPTRASSHPSPALHRRKALALTAALVLAGCGCGRGRREAFTVRAWTPDEGPPTSTVTRSAHTRRLLLNLATTGGLARFDGCVSNVNFGVADGLPSNRCSSRGCARARRSALRAATDDGWLCTGAARASRATRRTSRFSRAEMLQAGDGAGARRKAPDSSGAFATAALTERLDSIAPGVDARPRREGPPLADGERTAACALRRRSRARARRAGARAMGQWLIRSARQPRGVLRRRRRHGRRVARRTAPHRALRRGTGRSLWIRRLGRLWCSDGAGIVDYAATKPPHDRRRSLRAARTDVRRAPRPRRKPWVGARRRRAAARRAEPCGCCGSARGRARHRVYARSASTVR